MTTPCEERGYEVGQIFEINDEALGINGAVGDILILTRDDGSSAPYFDVVKAMPNSSKQSGYEGMCKTLSRVTRIYPPEEKSKDVEVTCNGKTTIISRRDAIKLNLCPS